MNANEESIAHSTVEDLRALLRDAEEVLASAGDQADDKIKELRSRMRAAIEDSRSTYYQIRDSAREQLDRADDYVRTHPYHAVGLAAAVGALAGLLFSRRLP